MNKRTRFFFGAVVALALLGLARNVQADPIFLGNDPSQNAFPGGGAFGQFFVPEGTIVQLAPTGTGPTVWARITTGGGVGGPNGTILTSFGKALGVDDLDDPLDKETKTDNDEWTQFEFYSDAATTTPTTLQIDIALIDFNREGDAGIATTFGIDGSSVLDGSHMFQDETGDSSGSGVTFTKSGDPSTLKDYLTFSQPAHIFRIQNDSTYVCTSSPDCRAGNGWKIAYFDPGDYVVLDAILACDFDGMNGCDIDDLDALVAEIVAETHGPNFDLNGDGFVTRADITDETDGWLIAAGEENIGPGRGYLEGDANLDGVADVSDFNLWNNTKFTSVAAWSAGDFTADGFVDVSDFNVWNSNKFTSSDGVTAVPEPGAFGLAWIVFAFLVRRRN